jgi:hypothetical protein
MKIPKLDEANLSTVVGGILLTLVTGASLLGIDANPIIDSFNIWVTASKGLIDTLSVIQFGEISIVGAISFLLFRHKSKKSAVSADQSD